jgi:hypothetical protein
MGVSHWAQCAPPTVEHVSKYEIMALRSGMTPAHHDLLVLY